MPGIRPSDATYGRLARYSTNATLSMTARTIPARTDVRRTPTMAVTAMKKSVWRHFQ